MDFMTGLKRTDYCGDFRVEDCGREVVVCGWVQRQRDLGALIFIDLRDRTGIVQLAFDDSTAKDIFDKAFTVRSEFVLMAKGIVRERSSKNMEIPTGEIEVVAKELDEQINLLHPELVIKIPTAVNKIILLIVLLYVEVYLFCFLH